MAGTFIDMVSRIATELRRSNMTTEIKFAINDAIAEAAKARFYFNEMRGVTFNTVIGQEYYSDQGLVEIDTLYYVQGGTRYNLYPENNLEADMRADGNQVSGQLTSYSRQGQSLRLYPLPTAILPIYADGYGKLAPWPLTADADANEWMVSGERLVRAKAKAILLKDVLRDYGEATALEAIAGDYEATLAGETNQRFSTGTLRPTQW